MISQDVTKEEREGGVKGAILGNAKIIKVIGNQPITTNTLKDEIPSESDLDKSDNIPF